MCVYLVIFCYIKILPDVFKLGFNLLEAWFVFLLGLTGKSRGFTKVRHTQNTRVTIKIMIQAILPLDSVIECNPDNG